MASIRIAIAGAGTTGRTGTDSIVPGAKDSAKDNAKDKRCVQFDAAEKIGTPDLVHMKGRI